MDWSSMIEFNVSPVELLVRGTAIYWFLFLVFRFLRHPGALQEGVELVLDKLGQAGTGGSLCLGERCRRAPASEI